MFPKSPIMSIKDLIAYARANPGKLLFGSAGEWVAWGIWRRSCSGFRPGHYHPRSVGTGPVMTALLSGEVHSSFSSLVPSMPHIKAGRLRAIGVTPSRRVPALPDVPSISETVPGYEVVPCTASGGRRGCPGT
jgi:tripartite-type tricarboxylate transporter receptor subunit TctC